MNGADLRVWLDKELLKAEHALACRRQAQETWSSGDDQEWRRVSRANGTRYMGKEERLEIANREGRIAVRAAKDIEAIKALIEIVNAVPGTE
jgi:hypothetical protein